MPVGTIYLVFGVRLTLNDFFNLLLKKDPSLKTELINAVIENTDSFIDSQKNQPEIIVKELIDKERITSLFYSLFVKEQVDNTEESKDHKSLRKDIESFVFEQLINEHFCHRFCKLTNDLKIIDTRNDKNIKSEYDHHSLISTELTHDVSKNGDIILGIVAHKYNIDKYEKSEPTDLFIDYDKLDSIRSDCMEILLDHKEFDESDIKLYVVQNDCYCCS